MTIYYKTFEVWCDYPFQDMIDYRYCEFSYSKRKFKKIDGLNFDSNTSLEEKINHLKKELNLKNVSLIKIK
jgi:hypothetical protein